MRCESKDSFSASDWVGDGTVREYMTVGFPDDSQNSTVDKLEQRVAYTHSFTITILSIEYKIRSGWVELNPFRITKLLAQEIHVFVGPGQSYVAVGTARVPIPAVTRGDLPW